MMNRIGPGLVTLTIGALLIVSWEQPAYAYLDPGSGSFMLQVLFGGVAGAVVLFKMYWSGLRKKLGFRHKSTETDTDEQPR
jgi:hypothetical protein